MVYSFEQPFNLMPFIVAFKAFAENPAQKIQTWNWLLTYRWEGGRVGKTKQGRWRPLPMRENMIQAPSKSGYELFIKSLKFVILRNASNCSSRVCQQDSFGCTHVINNMLNTMLSWLREKINVIPKAAQQPLNNKFLRKQSHRHPLRHKLPPSDARPSLKRIS